MNEYTINYNVWFHLLTKGICKFESDKLPNMFNHVTNVGNVRTIATPKLRRPS